jgi:hypothetical protein
MSMQIGSSVSISTPQISTSKAAGAGSETAVGVPYSAHVGSKTYSANVEQYAGEFEGNVPNLFGASTTATTVGKVEDKLSALIDFFA